MAENSDTEKRQHATGLSSAAVIRTVLMTTLAFCTGYYGFTSPLAPWLGWIGMTIIVANFARFVWLARPGRCTVCNALCIAGIGYRFKRDAWWKPTPMTRPFLYSCTEHLEQVVTMFLAMADSHDARPSTEGRQ